MFEIIIGILPFIIPSSILKENLATLILFLVGSIFIIKNKNNIKENKYFYIIGVMSLLILLSQLIISPYIESISGSFLYLNMAIYYLIYRYIIKYENKDEVLKYILLSITVVSLFYIFYHGLYQGIRVFGNIGYANSYALLALVSLYLNKIRKKDNLTEFIEIILFLTLLFTGSRTTLILSLIYIAYKLYSDYKYKNIKVIISLEGFFCATILYIIMEKLRIYSLLVIPILIILYYFIKNIKFRDKLYYGLGVIVLISLIISNNNLINRFKEISLYTGTLQERLLIYGDSIKSITKHPLGNGINMFQYKSFDNATAFYDVKYIHNSYLQVAYDTGIVNALIFITVIILGLMMLIKSKSKHKFSLILSYGTILLHSLLDFDLSFSTFPIIFVMLVALGHIRDGENKKDKIVYEDNKKQAFNLSKYLYISIASISIYLIIFETSIVIGNYFIDTNSNLSDKIFSFSNNISFKRDYRGYFNKAKANKNLYDESKDENYLKEGVSLLEACKEINPFDPMLIWNLSYLYEALGQNETALNLSEEVLERERFYPAAYTKQYDYLMKLYGETNDKKYEDEVNKLEYTYYKNYKELNKRAKYMNNQLQENFDDIRDKNIDYNILLNKKYENKIKYFNQEDEEWARYPYKTDSNPLGETGCGVTAMAMIQSTIKEKEITPIEMAEYSIKNGYCNNNTEVEFFDNVVKDERYKLNVEKFNSDEISKVKRLVSDGKHIAVALMRQGDFTTEGHYLVLYGIETINGINYFNALDSNKDNNNYKDNENIIYNNPKDGFIKVKSSLFLEQCIQFWVYSI